MGEESNLGEVSIRISTIMGIKVSFITTVYNEEGTIKSLLNSLEKQTVTPDEIIIVDAKSSDKTVQIINDCKNNFKKSKIYLYSKNGNRSIGRNAAIQKAKGNIIIATDAGCILDKKWVERLTLPFKNPKIDVVAGFYKPVTTNTFEKSLACYTCVMEDKVDYDFLPSSRSVAFRKIAWEKVGGYPENLNTCEDLIFARKLKRAGFTFKVVKNAIVYWPQRKNIIEAAKQFFQYAVGDGQAHYIRSNTWFLFARYIIGLALFFISKPMLLLCFLLYIIWSISKNYRYVNHSAAIFYLPLLQIVSDIEVIAGTTWGMMH